MSSALVITLTVAIVATYGFWLHASLRLHADRHIQWIVAAAGVATGLALAATLLPEVRGWGLAGLGVMGLFWFVQAMSPQHDRPARIAVGGPIADFVALDAAGRPFDLSALRGRPFLLKFFRGHWCPFCVAELERWATLAPDLAALGLRMVAISPDDVAATARFAEREFTGITLLSDVDLKVTDRYGLRREKSFTIDPKRPIFRALAIPTTILVGADGTVLWIDRATDYRVRSNPARVLPQIRAALAGRPPVFGGVEATEGTPLAPCDTPNAPC